MTTLPLRRLLATIVLGLAVSQAAAESTAPTVENLGNSTYRVSASATHKFTRNTARLKENASAAASEFCAKQGKQLKIVKVEETKSFYGVGDMARATLTFKALDLTDPELAASANSAGTAANASSAASLTNEALYADLLRLDDLRKKGILTDDEFAAEKKKILERSK
jgi:putative hemolysin